MKNYDRKVDANKFKMRHDDICRTRKSDEIEESLRQIISYCVLKSAKFCVVVDKIEIDKFLNNENSEFNSLLNRINAEFFNGPEGPAKCKVIVNDYAKLRQISKELTDIRKQESELDYSNRRRFLVFRFLTGLSFAFTVLLAGFISGYFGIQIQLPLSLNP